MQPIKYTPKQEKGALSFLFQAALIGGGLYFALRGLAKLFEANPNKDQQKSALSLLNQLNQNPQTKQTISNYQAQAYANGIFQAMNGYGTDFAYIGNAFMNIHNNADYLALQAAYGTREVSSGNLNPEPNYKGPLNGALANELDSQQLQVLNYYLGKKGITFRV